MLVALPLDEDPFTLQVTQCSESVTVSEEPLWGTKSRFRNLDRGIVGRHFLRQPTMRRSGEGMSRRFGAGIPLSGGQGEGDRKAAEGIGLIVLLAVKSVIL